MIAFLDTFCIEKSLNPFKSICQILLNFANDWCISVFVNEYFFFSKLHVTNYRFFYHARVTDTI